MGDFKQKSMCVEAAFVKSYEIIRFYKNMLDITLTKPVWSIILKLQHSSCGFLAVWAGKWTREVGANPKR